MKIRDSILTDKRDLSTPDLSDAAAISKLYLMYKEPFITFIVKYFDCDQNTAADLYQDSFIILYHKIKDGLINHLTSSLKTYLFQIGKFQMLKQFRNSKNMPTIRLYDGYENISVTNEKDWQRMQDITWREVSSLEEPCFSVLSLYYWERKNMVEIAEAMSYKNEQVAKNRKSLCIKKLKSILAIRFKNEGLKENV